VRQVNFIPLTKFWLDYYWNQLEKIGWGRGKGEAADLPPKRTRHRMKVFS
jgi:hypothetical protein